MMTANQYRTPASPNARRSSHGAGASTSGGGSRQALLLRLDKLITESEEMVKGADEIIRDLFDAALFAKDMEDAALVQTLKESLRKILIKQNEMRTRGQGLKEAKEQGMATEDIVKYVERAQAEVSHDMRIRAPLVSLTSPPPAVLTFSRNLPLFLSFSRTREASGRTSSSTAKSGTILRGRSRARRQRELLPAQAKRKTRTSSLSQPKRNSKALSTRGARSPAWISAN